MPKILTVVGARPNFIKLALLHKAMSREWECVLVHTGQHYDRNMSQAFFEELEIPEPAYNLGVGSGTHAEMTGKIMIELEKVLVREKPRAVMVVGDTNSALSGAIAAKKLKLPLIHLEAGIRCWDRKQPEELNRLIVDKISDLCLCPTKRGAENLRREDVAGVFVGDVMLDNFLILKEKAYPPARVHSFGSSLLECGFYYLTLHREDNTDREDRLRAILEGISLLRPPVFFPLHPRTAKCISVIGMSEWLDGSQVILPLNPLPYLESLWMVRHAEKVITDSGGVQREAYFAGVPCVTLDETTPWPETVETGMNVLAGADTERILRAVGSEKWREEGRVDLELFGGGRAVERIMEVLRGYLR